LPPRSSEPREFTLCPLVRIRNAVSFVLAYAGNGMSTAEGGRALQRYGKKHGRSRGITPHALKLPRSVRIALSPSVTAELRLAYHSSYNLKAEQRVDIPKRTEAG
ncbi:hypothetical protein, partial [Methylobacterium sp. BTF04]|uniref:hypothetical protein n=1 Tax=Methylobacterium sp. BTF04 TaxID=2708300 RepID=UPI001954D38A